MARIRNYRIGELLPWYINETLDQQEKKDVEEWLREEPQAATELEEWDTLRQLIQRIPQQNPPHQVFERIKDRIDTHIFVTPKIPSGFSWMVGGFLTMVLVLVLWITLQPGLTLRWSVEGTLPEEFRLYRYTSSSGEYRLVRVIEANPNVTEYEYTDLQILFNREYRYRIEGLFDSDVQVVHQSISASSSGIIIDQMMIIISSLFIGFAASIYLEAMSLKYRFGSLAIIL